MQHLKTTPKPSAEAEAITQGLQKAYRKMLLFKQYKGTKVVMAENGKIVQRDPSELLKIFDERH